MARPLVIFGTGELAQLAHYYFTNDTQRRVAAFTVDAEYAAAAAEQSMELPVVDFDSVAHEFPPQEYDMFVAVGYTKLNAERAQKCESARRLGYRLASYVSSRASVWPDLVIGENCMIMEGNVIQPFVRIGDGVIMFCSSVVSHHVDIGANCFVSSETALCGGVRIGANCFIGANSTIREHLTIGRDCVIGASALILSDVADGAGHVATATRDSGIPSRRLSALL